jgi:spermidine synthase
LSSSESYMSKELRGFLSSIHSTLSTSFSDVLVMPGETAYFIASDDNKALTYDYGILMKRSAERGLGLKYVREYYLSSRLSEGSVEFTQRSIVAAGNQAINRDFRPISYYYDTVFWSARFKGSVFTRVLRRTSAGSVLAVSALAVLATAIFGSALVAGYRGPSRMSVLAVAANGFSQIVLQVVTLLSFQIIYGYMYYKLGLIITAFMGGLALGGSYAISMIPRLTNERRALMAAQTGLCIYPAAALALFYIASSRFSGPFAWVGTNLIFIVLPLVSGFLGGFIFALASSIYVAQNRDAGSSGGLIYGADLIGSCAGALIAGTLLIPVLGIPGTCFVAAAVNAAAVLTSIRCRDFSISGGM